MNIAEIENLSAAELKERRDELAAEAAKAEPLELAKRYVQARADAKLRDAKLSEQGTTITLLQEQVASYKAQAEGHAKRADANAAAVSAAESQLDEQRSTNVALAAENTKLAKLATDRRAVLAKIMSDVAPLLAAE